MTDVNKSYERVKAWRLKYPGRRNASDKKYRDNHKEQQRIAYAKCYNAKKDFYKERVVKWRKEHQDAIKVIDKRYRENNMDKVLTRNGNRRATLALALGTYANEEWVELKYSYLGICPYCGEKIVGATHRDHVVPISRGGSNSIDNIVPCCAPCNYKKNDRPLIVFMAGGLS